jgi:hypothetical protein
MTDDVPLVQPESPAQETISKAELDLRAHVHRKLDDLTVKSERVFQVGRVKADGFDSLEYRTMYKDCLERITTLWRGSAAQAKWLETYLIEYAWQHYPSRCHNERPETGPSVPDGDDVIYVVEWEPTPERLAEVAKIRGKREKAEAEKTPKEAAFTDVLNPVHKTPRGGPTVT